MSAGTYSNPAGAGAAKGVARLRDTVFHSTPAMRAA